MVDRIWELLEDKHGIRREDPASWTLRQPTGFQSLTRTGVFNSIVGIPLKEALNDLLGYEKWNSGKKWGAPLVTFPETDRTWDIPQNQWHLDFPVRGNPDELVGIRVLAFIAPVEPGGGGTVVVTGSHHLVKKLVETGITDVGHSASIRDALATSHPWFRGLWSVSAIAEGRVDYFMRACKQVDGVEVRVDELTGMTGDIILMHPWIFHAPALNTSRYPRMIISHSVFREGHGYVLSS
jgi:ectoine hydroxylase-related dioxygenase (phytanoyl-CoA dioxygenase family)